MGATPLTSSAKTHRSRIASVFLRAFKARGGDDVALAQRHAITFGRDGFAETSTDQIGALADAIATELDDPFFGLHTAMELPRGSYGILEYIARSAPTLRRALEELLRYQRLVTSARFELIDAGDEVALQFRSHVTVGRHTHEFTLALLHRIGAESFGPRLHVLRMWLAHERPASAEPLETYFGCPIEFGVGSTGFAVRRLNLDEPSLGADENLLSLLQGEADRQGSALGAEQHELLGTLRRHIERALAHGGTNANDAARALAMSPRTLQRRLGELDTTFQRVTDEVRFDLARMHLANERLALSEVAFLLGYRDLSPFVRAFRRWADTTPGEWRQRQTAK